MSFSSAKKLHSHRRDQSRSQQGQVSQLSELLSLGELSSFHLGADVTAARSHAHGRDGHTGGTGGISWLNASGPLRAMESHLDFDDDDEMRQQFALGNLTGDNVQPGAATLRSAVESGSLRRDTPMFQDTSGFEGRRSSSYNINANPFDNSASAEDLWHLQAAADEHGVLDSEFRRGDEARELLDRDAAEAELHGSLNGIRMGAEEGDWEESDRENDDDDDDEDDNGDDNNGDDSDDALRPLPKTLSYTTPHHLGAARLRPAETTPHNRLGASGIKGTPNFDGHSSRLGALDGNISAQDRPHFGLASPPRTPHGYHSSASSSAGASPEFSSSRRSESLHATSYTQHQSAAEDNTEVTNTSGSWDAREPEDTYDSQRYSTARRDSHAGHQRSFAQHERDRWSDSLHGHEGKGTESISASMAQYMIDEAALDRTAARQSQSVRRESFQSNAASDTTVHAPDDSATGSASSRRPSQHSAAADLPALHEGPLSQLLFQEVSDLGSFATKSAPPSLPGAPPSRISSTPAKRAAHTPREPSGAQVSATPIPAAHNAAATSGSPPTTMRSVDCEASPATLAASSVASGPATPKSTSDSLQDLMQHNASAIAQHLLSESSPVSVASLGPTMRRAAQQVETMGAVRKDTSVAQLLDLLDATTADTEVPGAELSLAQENLASLSALLGISRGPLDASRLSALPARMSGRLAGRTTGAAEEGASGSAGVSAAASFLPSPSEFSLGQVDDDLNDLSAVLHGRPAPTQAPVPAPAVNPLLTVQERLRLEREAKLRAAQGADASADAGAAVGSSHLFTRSFAAAAHSRSALGASASHGHGGENRSSHSRHTQHESTPDVALDAGDKSLTAQHESTPDVMLDREDKSLTLQPLEAVVK